METWRFIRSGLGTPAYNMAMDEAITVAHSEGRVPPTLRFYGWNPPTLSIGYFQKATEVDLEAVERQGIGFVRRPTGGRAVLHDQELTYSIIVAENYPGMPSGVTEAYRVLSDGLLRGFIKLGLDAQMVQLENNGEKRAVDGVTSAACFDAPSWYELVVEGRKVAGSAQMRHKGAVLQHGSVLLELDVVQLFDLLRFPNDMVKQRMQKSFHSKAIAINALRGELGLNQVTLVEAEEAFQQGFAAGMDVEFEAAEPSEYEVTLAEQLMTEKYGTAEWNMRR
jgi:lipoyl(octanoyl) transferase